MSVVLAVEEALATEIQEQLPGRVKLCRPDLTDTHPEDWEADGPAQIVATIFRELPQVVVLDVTLGGTRYLAGDAARVVLRLFDPPAFVLLAPRPSEQFARWADEAGVYGVVSGKEATVASEICRHVALARAYRAGRSPRAMAPVHLQREARIQPALRRKRTA